MIEKGLIFLLVVMLIGATALSCAAGPTRYAIAGIGDLRGFPQGEDDAQVERDLFAVLLPRTDLVVIMRPITESEYGSFQVQAISHQIIEQEMLTAAIVVPGITPSDVAALPSDLVAFLQQQVNAISGFAVFTVPSLDAP
ncbi:hypothetical protein J7J63_01975 [Candidatus Bipolaricaulota bacterium]|nr:hypothetical protein [Candidatus Bipolaricaulota bacterium]